MVEFEVGKYTIAWFKLAEFIARREKERALGIFKLLAHSLNNKGLVFQLEGDIFLSFQDFQKAIKLYSQAALVYEEEKKFLSAAAVYEQLINLTSEPIEFIFKMLKLYFKIGNKKKITNSINLLTNIICINNKFYEIDRLIMDTDLSENDRLLILELMVFGFLKDKKVQGSYLYKYIEQIADGYNRFNPKKLDEFIKFLEKLNSDLYIYILSYLTR